MKERESFVRISALLWADILVAYALFVMQNYLTDVWKLSLTHAAAILNFWNGLYRILPLFFLFFVDAFLGNFTLLVISSISYTLGIGFVTMSTPPFLAKSTGTCKQYEPECIGHTQKALFYTGMVLIAVGVAGNLVSLKPFLQEQKKKPPQDNEGAEPADTTRPPKFEVSQVVGLVIVVVVGIAGAIALPYIKPWTLRFGIPAICTFVGTVLFLSGSCGYKMEGAKPDGSPLTKVTRVFVAATRNIFQPYSDVRRHSFSDTSCLGYAPNRLPRSIHIVKSSHPPVIFARCLHKATINPPEEGEEDSKKNKWRVCTAAEVEEAKIAVRMVPMWMTFIVCGIVSSIGDTYFVEQSNNMKRNIGKLTLPPQILKLVKDRTGGFLSLLAGSYILNSPNIKAPRNGIIAAMVFSVLCCITAAKMENKRLKVIRNHGLLDKPDDDVPMSIYWLIFQFVLLAGLDSFLEKSVAKFYKDQAPPSMTNYLQNFVRAVSGLGFMCSSLSVYIVGKISERGGRPNWFQHTLNRSRLDRYYWVLACLSSVNLFVFLFVSRRYKYRKWEPVQGDEAPEAGGAYTDGYTEENLASAIL
ncbi:hypothetical protein C2S52_006686 [Perilla frutescens var. hirtella]|nr:hypothetical protein C2S51_009027 [Perilla frutescens var. frutescens]KAH6787134.1 hypothetical protein C2S52_006686 [Perilla frutescens var. hirtella]